VPNAVVKDFRERIARCKFLIPLKPSRRKRNDNFYGCEEEERRKEGGGRENVA
jgi:hypothetical protein